MASSSAIAVSSPPFAASAWAARRLRALPRCQSLRLRSAAAGPRNRRVIGRSASVVCEVQGQDTAVQVPDVTKSTWQSLVTDSELPVLVMFWASWCGPCKMIDPVIGKLSKEYEGKLKCYKLNTDENPDITTQFGIRSIPTMVIYRNGEKKDAVIGAVPESTLITCIEKFVER